MDYDIHAALAAGVSPDDIAAELAKRPDAVPYDVNGALQAGIKPAEIVKEIAAKTPQDIAGKVIGPQAAGAISNVLHAVVPGSIQRGRAHMIEGMANTADVLGAPNVGGYLHQQVDKDQLNAPSSQEALGKAINEGHWGSALYNVPGAIGEGVPQIAGAAAGAAAGTAIAGPLGTAAGLAGGFGADALLGIVTQAGDIAQARAKADGREAPNDQDIAVAVGSSAVLGALGRIGLGEAAGGLIANGVKNLLGRGAVGAAGKVATGVGSAVAHGASDAVGAVGQQLAETAGTQQGATVDPGAVAAQAVTGMGTRTALGAARLGTDVATGKFAEDRAAAQQEALKQRWQAASPEDQQAIQNQAAARQQLLDTRNADTENPVKPSNNVAARTAADSYADQANRLVDTLSKGDAAVLDADQTKQLRGLISDARNTQRTITPEAIQQTLGDLPLSEDSKAGLADAIKQIDMLSTAGVGNRNTSGLGRVLGAVGAFAGATTPHPYLGAQLGGNMMSRVGDALSRRLGLSDPALLKEGSKAAAMLDAAGVPIPETKAGLVDAIGQSQDAMKVMARLAGLNPDDYGWSTAERRAMERSDLKAWRDRGKQEEAAWKQNDKDKQAADAVDVAKQGAFETAEQQKQAEIDAAFKQMEQAQKGQSTTDPNTAAVTRDQIKGYLANQSQVARDQSLRVSQEEASVKEGDRQAARGQSEMDRLQRTTEDSGIRLDRTTDKLTPGEVAAVQRAAVKPTKASAAPPAPANDTGAPAAPTASTGSMSAPAPELAMTPSERLAARSANLPKWMWKMGQWVQKDLQMSGDAKNLNYAQEANQVLHDLHDQGWIDTKMRDALANYQGEIMPNAFYRMIRQQWLLNHGIDRRSLDAQGSAHPMAQAAE